MLKLLQSHFKGGIYRLASHEVKILQAFILMKVLIFLLLAVLIFYYILRQVIQTPPKAVGHRKCQGCGVPIQYFSRKFMAIYVQVNKPDKTLTSTKAKGACEAINMKEKNRGNTFRKNVRRMET